MLSVRRFVFAGALLAVVPFAAVAEEKKAEPKAMPAPVAGPAGAVPAPGAGDPCAPQTVKVCKLVPTQVQETRTVMKQVQKQETYTAYRNETVQEKKIVPVTTYKTETYTEMVTRTHCVKVPCWEEKTVMEKRKKIEWVTEYKEKCHISFQKECKTIGGHDCCNKGGGHCDKGDGCCDKGDGCHKGFSFSFPVVKPVITKTCEPVCVPKCTYECVPVTKKCCTWKTETKTECVPVCKTRCVPCTENKEVVCCKTVCVPYQATRCVTECVPCTETVTVCKMVPTWVEEACPAPCPPAANACPPAAANPCPPACPPAAANACPPAAANACPPACHNPCDTGDKGGCCLFDKFKGCCDKFKGCCDKAGCHLDAAKCNICDKVSHLNCNVCDKVSHFNCNVHDKFAGCCNKLKGCIPSCHINFCCK